MQYLEFVVQFFKAFAPYVWPGTVIIFTKDIKNFVSRIESLKIGTTELKLKSAQVNEYENEILKLFTEPGYKKILNTKKRGI